MYKKKITVLVAENKDENCPSALQQALAALPEVESAHLVTNGAKVQSEVRGLRPDVLLLDLVLPVLDGLEILKKLQTARLPKMPVIIVSTAISREAIIDEAIRLGAAYYLPKAAAPNGSRGAPLKCIPSSARTALWSRASRCAIPSCAGALPAASTPWACRPI